MGWIRSPRPNYGALWKSELSIMYPWLQKNSSGTHLTNHFTHIHYIPHVRRTFNHALYLLSEVSKSVSAWHSMCPYFHNVPPVYKMLYFFQTESYPISKYMYKSLTSEWLNELWKVKYGVGVVLHHFSNNDEKGGGYIHVFWNITIYIRPRNTK